MPNSAPGPAASGNPTAWRGDQHHMRCTTCREALSARLDDEDPGPADALVDDHLVRCAGCQAYAAAVADLRRRTVLRPAEPVPDLTNPILARAHKAGLLPGAVTAGGHWSRWALLAVGLVQLALAIPALAGIDGGLPVHAARELGAWYLALAGALLVVVWRPRHAGGLVPFAVGLAAAMAIGAGLDVAAGRASIGGEAQHLIDLAGLALLVVIARRPYDDGPLFDGLHRPRPAAA